MSLLSTKSLIPRCLFRFSLICHFKSNSRSINTNTVHRKSVKILINPKECLHDEPVQIQVKGLEPKQLITLSAIMLDSKDICYLSHSHYSANNVGKIDVDTMASTGGSYSGVFPMGLLSSIKTAPGEKHSRFFKRDVHNPNNFLIHVQSGHLTPEEVMQPEVHKLLDTVEHFRHYMAPGVTRHLVEDPVVHGALFLPPGDGPYPGLIDIYGSTGGIIDSRAAQFASRGFATLALPYFDYKDLPETMADLNFSYFEEAVKYLLAQNKVFKSRVGVIGLSKGGDLALALGTFIPQVTAVVSINGCISSVTSNLKLSDRTIPGLQFDYNKIKLINEDLIDFYDVLNDPADYPDTIIPINEADANFLFVIGGKDRILKNSLHIEHAANMLKNAGKHNYKVLEYPNAGHLIEAPYSPFCDQSFHKIAGINMVWGGDLYEHTIAQEHSWKDIRQFLYDSIINYNQTKL